MISFISYFSEKKRSLPSFTVWITRFSPNAEITDSKDVMNITSLFKTRFILPYDIPRYFGTHYYNDLYGLISLACFLQTQSLAVLPSGFLQAFFIFVNLLGTSSWTIYSIYAADVSNPNSQSKGDNSNNSCELILLR